MEDLPHDLSEALKESSKVVEQTVRRHNRKRRGKKRRSNPDLDFDLNEVDFPNRSDASSGERLEGEQGGGDRGAGGDRGEGAGEGVGNRGGGSSRANGGASVGVAENGRATGTSAAAAAAAPAAAGSSCLPCGVGGRCSAAGASAAAVVIPTVLGLLHRSSSSPMAGGRAAAASAAARSDSDDVHIAARLSALTLPPTAALLPCTATAAAAAATTRSAAGVCCAGAACGHVIKDLESDSVTEKSPVRRLNQRRRRRLRHMLVDEAIDAPVALDAGARVAIKSKPPASTGLHGRRTSEVAASSSSSSNVLAQAGPVRQLWKRKRKQKMDTSEGAAERAGAAVVAAAFAGDGDCEDERMQGELLSSELSSTSSEDECSTGRWSHHRGGAAVYDEAQEGDDEQSDFFHEPGPAYGIPPGTAVLWWGKENKSGSDARPASVPAGCPSSVGSHVGCCTQSKDGFLTPFAGDERFSKHRLFSKLARRDVSGEQTSPANSAARAMQLDRPFRIGRRRLKSASYRPAHDDLGYYVAGGSTTSSTRACSSLVVPSQLAQQLSHNSDVKRRRKTNLPTTLDEPSSASVSRSILIPQASTMSHTSKRGNDGLAHASL